MLFPKEELDEERELLDGAFDMNLLFEGDKRGCVWLDGAVGGSGLIRIPGLVLALVRRCEWNWVGCSTAAMMVKRKRM